MIQYLYFEIKSFLLSMSNKYKIKNMIQKIVKLIHKAALHNSKNHHKNNTVNTDNSAASIYCIVLIFILLINSFK